MFLLHDALVTRANAWWVVTRLRVVGRADETIAAAVIEQALTDRAQGVTLTPAECEALLEILSEAPSGLFELRDTLTRDDHEWR